jgi:hypothetical protein
VHRGIKQIAGEQNESENEVVPVSIITCPLIPSKFISATRTVVLIRVRGPANRNPQHGSPTEKFGPGDDDFEQQVVPPAICSRSSNQCKNQAV